MCQNTCGQCVEFLPTIKQCGQPMVYLDHESNKYYTTADAKSCGYFSMDKKKELATEVK